MSKTLDNQQGRKAIEEVRTFLGQVVANPNAFDRRIGVRAVVAATGVHHKTLRNHGLLSEIERVEGIRVRERRSAGLDGGERKSAAVRRAEKAEAELALLRRDYDNLLKRNLTLEHAIAQHPEIDYESLLNTQLPRDTRGTAPKTRRATKRH
jgi:hypothetical protein